MIPLLSRVEARRVDAYAEEVLGVPTASLMENAGAGAASGLIARAAGDVAAALILGGVGQNGGDAWVVARHLIAAGFTPTCFLLGDPEGVRGDAARNLAALRALGVRIEDAENVEAFEKALRSARVVVDGLFGTGLSRAIEGTAAACIEQINGRGMPVLALDLPSGIDADTGQILGRAIRARWTATFGGHKRGLHQHPGAAHAGEIFVVPLGAPCPCPDGVPQAHLIEETDVARAVLPRTDDAHKGTAGHVVVVAGSEGKTGAALLAARGALRAGAGLVSIAPREQARGSIDVRVIEFMTEPLDTERVAQGKHAMVLGPGLGLDAEGVSIARSLAMSSPIPTVIDADALTAWVGRLADLRHAAAPRVLTPHPGEAARLLGCTSADVQNDRYTAARALANAAGQVVVLKGACSVIAAPDGSVRVCGRGTPALGVGGTGDVLAGAIGAHLVVLSALEAASCGVFLHAAAGEIAANADRGLLASEVADALPRALSTTWQSAFTTRGQHGNPRWGNP